ncbi:MAG: hypothetical protein AAB479_00085 [Patescibacteria group bacterium]
MESLIGRTVGASDAGVLDEKQMRKLAKGQARLKLKEARKGLSRDEYVKWAREQSVAGTDFEAVLKNRIAELEQQLEKTSNEFLREQLGSRISQVRMLLEAEEVSRASDRMVQEMEEAEEFVFREKALQRGPLFSRRMKWWLGDQWSRCVRLVNAGRSGLSSAFSRTIAAIGHLYGPVLLILSGLTILAGLYVAIVFAAISGLELNLVFVTVASIVFALMAFSGTGKIWRTMVFITILAFYGTNVFVWCLAPNAGYAGARRQQEKIVEILDSRDWLIRPPAFGRDERLEWIDLTKPEYRGVIDLTWAMVFRENIVSSNNFLRCDLDLFLRREGFRELFETGRTPDSYRQELRQQVQKLFDQFAVESSVKEINRIREEITRVHNNLFGVSKFQIRIRQ